MNRHVVFGTGQVGHPLVTQLVAQGHEVVAVNHTGRGDFPGAQVIAGNATDPAFTTAVCEGAAVVYFCLNAVNYERWTEEFPPLQRGVLAGAASAGARLVVLDNLYAYGPPNGQRLVETMADNPTSTKSATRAAMTEELLAAHAAGRIEVVIGRASDYFGPGATRSALGETIFGTALAGKAAQVMGDPDQPHSYSYTPDVAAALISLGTAGTTGQVWHLPVAETRTIRQVVEAVYRLASQEPSVFAHASGDGVLPSAEVVVWLLALLGSVSFALRGQLFSARVAAFVAVGGQLVIHTVLAGPMTHSGHPMAGAAAGTNRDMLLAHVVSAVVTVLALRWQEQAVVRLGRYLFPVSWRARSPASGRVGVSVVGSVPAAKGIRLVLLAQRRGPPRAVSVAF